MKNLTTVALWILLAVGTVAISSGLLPAFLFWLVVRGFESLHP